MTRGTGKASPLVWIGVAALVLVAGVTLRGSVGADLDTSPEGLRAWVQSWGLWGPVLFTFVVTFRVPLLVPSALILIAGGLCFGVLGGTVLGALGVWISGAFTFGLARGTARDWFRRRFEGQRTSVARFIERAGPVAVAVLVGHPLGSPTAAFTFGGTSPMGWATFLAACAVGSICRALLYAWFGAGLLDRGSTGFILASVVLVAVVGLPALHPGFRRWVLGREDPPPA